MTSPNKTFNGIVWSGLEKFSLQLVQFLLSLLMARMLTPADFGLMAMISFFLSISQVFIDSGLGSALIQKDYCDEIDFSTVFFYNFVLALIIFAIIFFLAPFIANFYSLPELVSITRVMGLNLVFSSFLVVPRTILAKDINFKTLAKTSFFAAIFSGFLGVSLAFWGMGVWSLVWQAIANTVLSLFLISWFLKWKPKFVFSRSAFYSLFPFGSKLLIANVISSVYSNLHSVVIGKKFSANDLGYFTRANQFAMFPSNNLGQILARVTFPILSSIQNDDKRLKEFYCKCLAFSSFIIFPLMMGLIILSKPIVFFVLSDKWEPSVELLKILCFSCMWDHICLINLNLLYVKGRTDLVLKLEIIKKTIALVILFASIRFGVKGICLGSAIYSLFAVFINAFYTKRLIQITYLMQIRHTLQYFFYAILMGLLVQYSIYWVEGNFWKILIGSILGTAFYAFISFILNLEPAIYFFRKILAIKMSLIVFNGSKLLRK